MWSRTRARAPVPHELAMAMWDGSPTRPGRAKLGSPIRRTRLDPPRRVLRYRAGRNRGYRRPHRSAGKTTIISLLLRFYDVQKGAVRIDGVDVKEMDLPELRRRFGVVLQDPFLFTGTVEGNIRLGTEWITDADIEKAAEDVNLADFIRTLPQGFKEEVRERGSTLSTGQKQLISFRPRAGSRPEDPDSGRSHLERRYRNRGQSPRRP